MTDKTDKPAVDPTEETVFFREFLSEVGTLFNGDPDLWSCEFCRWVACDKRICDICEVLQEACNDAEGEG
jgi:hypothetical protein